MGREGQFHPCRCSFFMNNSGIQFQIFANAKRKSPSLIGIDELAEAIRTGGANGAEKLNTQWARETLAAGGDDEYQSRKGDIFRTVSVGGVYDGKGFRMDNITSLTGYLMVDIDGVVDENYAAAIRDGIFADSQLRPVLAFVSPSGHGVKLLFRMRNLEGGGTKDEMQQRYNGEFRRICAAIVSVRGGMFDKNDHHTPPVEMDISSQDMTRCCFVAHDPQCKYDDTLPYSGVDELLFPDDCGAYLAAMRTLGWDVTPTQTVTKEQTQCTATSYDTSGDIAENSQTHSEICEEIKKSLHRDANGDYIYDKNKRLHIGSRSKNTADVKIEINGVVQSGWELKWRLCVVALWLFDYDEQRADDFLSNTFDEYPLGNWHRCTLREYKDLTPAIPIMHYLFRELNFQRESNFTNMVVEGGSARSYLSDDSKFVVENDLPPILSRWLTEDSVPPQYRDIYFYAALAVLSGFAPNQYVKRGNTKYGLNIQSLFVGAQGTGKGNIKYPKSILLNRLDHYCDYLNEFEERRVNEWNKRRSATKMECDGDSDDSDEYKAALRFENVIQTPTRQYVVDTLPANNAKCLLFTEEMTEWAKVENGSYAGICDAMKKTYDNDNIVSETVHNKRTGATMKVYGANFAVLASGTPGAFKKLFTTIEEGEMRRIMAFLLEDSDYDLMLDESINDYADIESFFIQWFMYHFFSDKNIVYKIPAANRKEVRRLYNDYVNENKRVWGGATTVQQAMGAVFGSVPVMVFRVAALLQSLHDFWYSGKYDLLFNADNWVPPFDIPVYDDYIKGFVTRTADDFIETARSRMTPYSKTNADKVVDLRMEWIMAAHEVVNRRIPDLMSILGAYSPNALNNGVSDPNQLIYKLALDYVDEEFTPSDYASAYARVAKKNVEKQYVNRCLNKLVSQEYISKSNWGKYKKNLKHK